MAAGVVFCAPAKAVGELSSMLGATMAFFLLFFPRHDRHWAGLLRVFPVFPVLPYRFSRLKRRFSPWRWNRSLPRFFSRAHFGDLSLLFIRRNSGDPVNLFPVKSGSGGCSNAPQNPTRTDLKRRSVMASTPGLPVGLFPPFFPDAPIFPFQAPPPSTTDPTPAKSLGVGTRAQTRGGS